MGHELNYLKLRFFNRKKHRNSVEKKLKASIFISKLFSFFYLKSENQTKNNKPYHQALAQLHLNVIFAKTGNGFYAAVVEFFFVKFPFFFQINLF